MNATEQSLKLNTAIRNFQTVLDSQPTMESDQKIRVWAEQAHATFKSLHELINFQRLRVRKKWFEAVGNQDEAQLNRVRELIESDVDVEKLCDVVESQIIVLTLPTFQEETDQEAQVQNLIDRGWELINWIRDQEDAVTDWFSETFGKYGD